MTLECLDPANESDRKKWMAAFHGLPEDQKDVHWLPEYAEAHCLTGVVRGWLDVEDGTLCPFICRDSGTYSPYGYGGVLGERGCLGMLQCWSSYRFHPWIGDHWGDREKDVVVLNLQREDNFSDKHDYYIRKAIRGGVTTFGTSNLTGLDVFHDVYAQTMGRHNAADGWRLSASHFRNMADILGHHLSLFTARVRGDIETVALILHGFGTAYYHFAGSLRNHPQSGANPLLIARVAEWARDKGYSRLHLGGGVTAFPDDSLLKFKKGFGGDLLPVYRTP